MKLKIFVLTVINFLSAISIAEIVVPGKQASPQIAAPAGTFTPYLSCLNRIGPPIARRLNLNMGENLPLEQQSAIFSGANGIYLIEPNKATVDQVPLHTPPSGQGMPEYPLAYKEPGRADTAYLHYYVDPATKRGDGAGGGWGEEFRNFEGNANTPFFEIGKESSRINTSDAIQAITSEVVPSINSMNESLASFKEFLNRRDGKRGNESHAQHLERAKEALCACAETNQTEIASAARQEATELSLDISSCGQALVSQNDLVNKLMKILLPMVYAGTKAVSTKHPSVLVHFANPILSLSPVKQNLKVCGPNGSYRLNPQEARLIAKEEKCSPKDALSKTVTLKKVTAHIPDYQTLIINKN
jgi:hypothetical protein